LKTWIYRIALHEAANRRRWWFRHKAKETSIEPVESDGPSPGENAMQVALTDHAESPFDSVAHHEVQHRVEEELRKVPEPYRTTLVLRDLEEMSYEEIAEVLEISLGTVKSRLTRGRDALRQRLAPYVREVGNELGLTAPAQDKHESRAKISQGEASLNQASSKQASSSQASSKQIMRNQVAGGGRRVEVTS
jgi:RNA polymerase sigma-70 factor (ECF subfamily)